MKPQNHLFELVLLLFAVIWILNSFYKNMTCNMSNHLLSFKKRKSLLLAKLDACNDMGKLMEIRTAIDALNEWAYDNVIEKPGYENRVISRRLIKEVEKLEKEYRKRFDALRL